MMQAKRSTTGADHARERERTWIGAGFCRFGVRKKAPTVAGQLLDTGKTPASHPLEILSFISPRRSRLLNSAD